jgi:hypothetical protein
MVSWQGLNTLFAGALRHPLQGAEAPNLSKLYA